MDSGCGTFTTELTSVMSSMTSRTVPSEAQSRQVVHQSSGNNSHQQVVLSVPHPTTRPPAPPHAVPATCPAKPQQQQPAIPRY